MKKILFLLIILGGVYMTASFSDGLLFSSSNLWDMYYSFKSGILNRLAKSDWEKGEFEKSLKRFEKSESTVENITSPTKKIEKIVSIMQSRIETDEEQMAKDINKNIQKIIEELDDAQNEISEEDKNFIYGQTALIYTQIVDHLSASEPNPNSGQSPTENSTDPIDTSLFLFNVAHLYAQDGKIESAMETIEKIPDPYYKKAAWLTLLKTTLQKGDLETANNLMNNFGDESLRAFGHWEIAYSQIENGDINAAIETLKKLDN